MAATPRLIRAFAFCDGEMIVHVTKAPDRDLGGFDYAGGAARAIQHHIAPPDLGHRFDRAIVAQGPAGGGFHAAEDEAQQFIGQFRRITELEPDGILVLRRQVHVGPTVSAFHSALPAGRA